MSTDWALVFERTFAVPTPSVDRRIMREVYGDEYPEGVDPHSYVSRSELRRFVTEVGAVTANDGITVDLGCGRGGPGLWVAAHTGSTLVGVDIAHSATTAATERAREVVLSDRASFVVGTFDAVPLATGTADAVMSIDALLFAPDKAAALDEIARVLRPGGRLVFTSWDYRSQPVGRPPQVADHRPLLAAAGLDVGAYEETDDWYGRLARADQLTYDAVEELAVEYGIDVDELRAELEAERGTIDTMLRRVLCVATRR